MRDSYPEYNKIPESPASKPSARKDWVAMDWKQRNAHIADFEATMLDAFGNFPKKNWT